MTLPVPELNKLPEVASLDERQHRLVCLLLEGVEPAEAVKAAGYSDSTHWSVATGSLSVIRAIAAVTEAQLRGPMRLQAMLRLRTQLTDALTPAATAFNAAKLVLEYGGTGQADDKPLSERSTAELEAMIGELEAARNARMIDVTPSNGA